MSVDKEYIPGTTFSAQTAEALEEAEDKRPILEHPLNQDLQVDKPENWDTVQKLRQPRKPAFLDKRHTHIPTHSEVTASED